MKKYRYHYIIYNDGIILAYAQDKFMCNVIVNDLPCFSKSSIEIKKVRISCNEYARRYL